MKTISPIDIADTIAETLSIYDAEAREMVKASIDAAADELVAELKATSPDSGQARTKKYREGWTKRTEYEDNLEKRVKVYNKTAYQLTHLLENGHQKSRGGRVQAIPHIFPAEEKAKESLVTKIEEGLRNDT